MESNELVKYLADYCPDTKVKLVTPSSNVFEIGEIIFDADSDTVLLVAKGTEIDYNPGRHVRIIEENPGD